MSSAADPAIGTVAVTLDVDLARRDCRALWVGGAGNLTVIMSTGETSTLVGVPAGTLLPIRVRQVTSATTATNIVAFY